MRKMHIESEGAHRLGAKRDREKGEEREKKREREEEKVHRPGGKREREGGREVEIKAERMRLCIAPGRQERGR